jgi:hypothetical protein
MTSGIIYAHLKSVTAGSSCGFKIWDMRNQQMHSEAMCEVRGLLTDMGPSLKRS